MRKIKEKMRQFYHRHYDKFDDMVYSAQVYAIFMVKFAVPLLALAAGLGLLIAGAFS